MSRRRIWVRRMLLAGLAVLIAEQVWRHGQDYVFPDKLVVVEPGRIYRGAWQHDWPMRRIVRSYGIKTIVALAHAPDHPLAVHEKALAQELGVRWVHIPIVEESIAAGQRRTVGDALEQAASVLADPASQPVFFHCHHGLNRAAMAQMAYRMQHCGWTLQQATDEIARTPMGLVKVKHGVDYTYMETFYNERVVPRRQAMAAAVKSPVAR